MKLFIICSSFVLWFIEEISSEKGYSRGKVFDVKREFFRKRIEVDDFAFFVSMGKVMV